MPTNEAARNVEGQTLVIRVSPAVQAAAFAVRPTGIVEMVTDLFEHPEVAGGRLADDIPFHRQIFRAMSSGAKVLAKLRSRRSAAWLRAGFEGAFDG